MEIILQTLSGIFLVLGWSDALEIEFSSLIRINHTPKENRKLLTIEKRLGFPKIFVGKK